MSSFKDIIVKQKKKKKDVSSLGVSRMVRTLWLEKKATALVS